MGIDVYAHWDGQTEAERKAQFTGFSIRHGHVGYLREAYHGGPYATQVLVPEGWGWSDRATEDGGVEISAALLRERLPAALVVARQRAKTLYRCEDPEPALQAFRDFVDLCERKERETGKPVKIYVSY